MIKLKKRRNVPAKLKSDAVTNALTEHRNSFDQFGRVTSKEFKGHIWRDDNVRTALWSDQNKKCCFCEQRLELKRVSDVEHFRPKARVTEAEDHPGYWWLAYTWKNLLYACKHCNEDNKINHFPLFDPRSRVDHENGDLSTENPKLINPYEENPEEHLTYEAIGAGQRFVYVGESAMSNKGGETAIICGLNRTELLEDRGQQLGYIQTSIRALQAALHVGSALLVKEATKALNPMISPESRFAGMARYYVRQSDLAEHLGLDD